MLGYLSLDIICSSKLTVFLELRSRKTVPFSEQMISADKYPSIFSRQMKAIVYISKCHLNSWKIILSCYVAMILKMKDSCSANLTFRAHN